MPGTRGLCAFCSARRMGLCAAMQDGQALRDLQRIRPTVRVLAPGDAAYHQGDPSDACFHVISGWLALHHDLPDGRRHVLRILLPGDMFGYESQDVAQMSHGVIALTDASICAVSARRLASLRARYRELNERFIWMITRDRRLGDVAIVTLVHGGATERICYLLVELARRLKGRAELAADTFRAPLTQALIGEATGLTQIHVNRVLRRLRERGVLRFQGGFVTILDPAALLKLAGGVVERESPRVCAPLVSMESAQAS